MKLKRILAGVLTAAMVVTSVPAAGLGGIVVQAEDTQKTLTINGKTYVLTETTASLTAATDAGEDGDNVAANALNSEDTKWHSAYNGDVQPISESEMRNNCIYLKLSGANSIAKLNYISRVNLGQALGGSSGNGNGSIVKARVYVSSSDAADKDGIIKDQDSWTLAADEEDWNAEYSSSVNTKEVVFDQKQENVKWVIIEVLDILHGGGNWTVGGKEIQLYDTADATEAISGLTAYADADPSDATNQYTKLVDGDVTTDFESAWDDNATRIYSEPVGLVANNNYFITLDEAKALGSLTYVSKQTNGAVKNMNVYVSNAELAEGQTVKDIEDWTLVHDGSEDNWANHSADSDNAHAADFTSVQTAKYVCIEVKHTYGTTADKFISAKQFILYEAEAVDQDIASVSLTVDAPAYNAVPATAVTVPDGAAYTAEAPVWTPAADKFAAGTEYTVSVKVAAKEGETFAETVAATVNGAEATVAANDDGTKTVSYKFAVVADPTSAHADLAAELAKGGVPVTNENADGTKIYTSASWSAYETAYNEAKALAALTDLTGKTPEEFNSAKEKFLDAKSKLQELGDVQKIEETPDVTVVAPEAGEAPADAALTVQGSLNTGVKVEYENMAIDEEGGISGRITAPNQYEENAVFKETSKFLFHFKLKTDKTSEKQSIVGVMNEQWGLQINGNTMYMFGHLSGGWYQTDYTIPDDDWYGQWHDIIAIHDGDLFYLYVDGTASTENPSYQGRHGSLVDYSTGSNPSVFTIGYNAGYEEGQLINGQDFTGKLRDLYMYRGDQVPEYTIEEGASAEDIQTMFAEKLQDKTPSFQMTGLPPKEQSGYTVESTTWTPDDETFSRYTDYKVEVVLKADEGKTFKSDATAVLRTEAGEITEGVTVTPNGDKMTISYTFAGEEHPRVTLRNYLASDAVKVGTEENGQIVNKGEDGARKYTAASWNTFVEAYNAATTAAADETLEPEVYTARKTALETAISGLALAANTCECTLSDITGFDGDSFELGAGETQKVTLGTGRYETSNACLKHPNETADVSYALVGSPAGATLSGNELTLTADATSVQVRVTVAFGDQTKTATATFTVTKKKASEEQKAALSSAAKDVEDNYVANADKYTEESWAEVQKALDTANALINNANATEEDVNNAKAAIAEALGKLEIKDKKALEDLMNEIAALNVADYTAASWNAMKAVYDEALKLDPNTATIADYSKAYSDLTAAKAALVTLADELAAAKADVNKALASAKAIIDKGQADYTAASWNTFKSAYDVAAAGAANNASTAAQLKAFLEALTKAQAALVKDTAPVVKDGEQVNLKSGRYEVISAAKKTAKLVKAKNNKKASISVPANITINGVKYKVVQVGPKAFKGFKNLKKITLSQNITTVGKQAFSGCKKLSSVVVKGTALKKFGAGAFKGTSKKMTVTFKAKKVTAKKRAALLKKMKKAGMSKSAKLK